MLMVRLERSVTSASDRLKVIALFWVCVLSIPVALFLSSSNPHEQTLVLERFANQFEQAQRVDVATEQYVRDLLNSIRRTQPTDQTLQRRQLLAIGRIVAVLEVPDDTVGALGRTGQDRGKR
jgi:hypothetical protein